MSGQTLKSITISAKSNIGKTPTTQATAQKNIGRDMLDAAVQNRVASGKPIGAISNSKQKTIQTSVKTPDVDVKTPGTTSGEGSLSHGKG